MNYLLPTDSLLEVVGSLVTHDLLSVRRKALDLLITKLQQLEPDSVRKSDVSPSIQLYYFLHNNLNFRMNILIKKTEILCIAGLSDV